MDIQVGEYVRSNGGYIAKIIGIKKGKRDCDTYYCTDKVMASGFYEHIKKHSKDIIDLIEVGDYVNGSKVIDIAQAPIKAVYTDSEEQKLALIPIVNDQIKSIITKEQFSQMEYKVKE